MPRITPVWYTWVHGIIEDLSENGIVQSERQEMASIPPNLHQRRYTFLMALRYGPIPFWQSLNAVWMSGNSDRLKLWLGEWGIIDRWLITDAIIPTLGEWERELQLWLAPWKAERMDSSDGAALQRDWNQNPDLSNARLDPEYRWFYYNGGEAFEGGPIGDEIRPFAPAGAAGLPRCSTPLNDADIMLRGSADQQQQLRAVARFEGGSFDQMLPRFFLRIESELPGVRRRGAHHKEWVDHKRYMRSLAEANQNMVRHAEWTALVWARMATPKEIARRWQNPRLRRWGQPEKLVSMAVRRFADSIELTLVK